MSGLRQKLSTYPEPGYRKDSERSWERGTLLQKESKGECPLSYDGSPVPWKDIARWLADEEECYVCPQTVRNNFEHTLERMRKLLSEDPHVRDWMKENGISLEREEDDHTDIRH